MGFYFLPLKEGGGQGPVLLFSRVLRAPGGGSHTEEKAAEVDPECMVCAAAGMRGGCSALYLIPLRKRNLWSDLG